MPVLATQASACGDGFASQASLCGAVGQLADETHGVRSANPLQHFHGANCTQRFGLVFQSIYDLLQPTAHFLSFPGSSWELAASEAPPRIRYNGAAIVLRHEVPINTATSPLRHALTSPQRCRAMSADADKGQVTTPDYPTANPLLVPRADKKCKRMPPLRHFTPPTT